MRFAVRVWPVGLCAVLLGCGSAAAAPSATFPTVGITAPPSGAGPAAAAAAAQSAGQPMAPSRVAPGSARLPYAYGPGAFLSEGTLTPLARRTTGTVTLRTFTQPTPSSSGSGCDPLNDACPPPWCAPGGLLVTELSTPAIAAVLTSPVIGRGPGSRISLLDGQGPFGPQNGQAPSVVGAAEGGPVQLHVVGVSADVERVRLRTPDGEDTTTPVRGLAALAVAGSSTSGQISAFDGRGRQVASVSLPAVPTAASAACQPRPPALPVPGRQPADPAAAAKAVRAAFRTAFTAEPAGKPYFSLGAVEGGSALHGALDQLRASFAKAVQTVSVSTGQLVFTSPTDAVTKFTLSYSGGAPYGTKNGTAVLRGGSWLVSRSTYCMVLGFGGASCPAQ